MPGQQDMKKQKNATTKLIKLLSESLALRPVVESREFTNLHMQRELVPYRYPA